MRSLTANCRKFLFLLLTGSALTAQAQAPADPVITQPILGSLDSFHVSAESYARDIKYFGIPEKQRFGITNNLITNVVGVAIDEKSDYFIPGNFSVNVTLEITRYDSVEAVMGAETKTFTVNYDTTRGAHYRAFDYATYNNAYALKARIVSIDSGNLNWPVSKVLRVENQIMASRQYAFDCSLALGAFSIAWDAPTGELKVSWDPPSLAQNAGVTEYDVEWAWVDKEAISRYQSNGLFDQKLLFDNNATRVSLSKVGYDIPMLYEGEGRLFVRVRPVQVTASGQRIEGIWTWIPNSTTQPLLALAPANFIYEGHEWALNWQARTSFAEEGKSKSVIQYFDGTLRNRQTVTKDHSTKNTVVAESFYDYQGRPIIQVLPAPTLKTAIQYTSGFNQAISYNEYPKEVYDELTPGGGFCADPAKPFNTDFGTANYYSGKNPLMAVDPQARFIPDATANNPDEAYAFSETRLSPDGQVAAQGGVGAMYQIGSNHDTKYYYDVPEQQELDALFGTDVGFASHYSKNMVRDANGQYSVSYVDMHGRTIATALIGEAPTNVLPLDNRPADAPITKQLLDAETNVVIGNSIVSTKPIVVPVLTNYHFEYKLTPEQLCLPNCNNQNICYNCVYDLTITITSDCSKLPVKTVSVPNYTLGSQVLPFDQILDEGSYVVTKTLTLNSAAQKASRDQFIGNDTCKKFVELYQQELQTLESTSNCNITCTSCKAALGATVNDFIQKYATEMGIADISTISDATKTQLTAAYNESLANCNRYCDNNDGLDEVRNIRELMLRDMTPPNGQYARETESARRYNIFAPVRRSIFAGPNPYSIISFLPGFRQPRQLNSTLQGVGGNNKYLDETGIEEPFDPLTITQNDFVSGFKPSWANQLLVHHPEFNKLKLCLNELSSSYLFEALLKKTETWADAASPTHNFITSIIDQDPFFNGPGAYLKQWMLMGHQNDGLAVSISDVNPQVFGVNQFIKPCTPSNCSQRVCASQYITMWQIALGAVFCQDKQNPANPCSTVFNDLTTITGCTMDPAHAFPGNNFSEGCVSDRDWAWQFFRNFYLSERRKLISVYLNQFGALPVGVLASQPTQTEPQRQLRFINYANPQAALSNAIDNNTSDPNHVNTYDIQNLISQASAGLSQGSSSFVVGQTHDQYVQNCKSYAAVWISELQACDVIQNFIATPANAAQWTLDKAWLMDRLVAICSHGADDSHPLGSSSTASVNGVMVGGTTYREFPEVIREYLQRPQFAAQLGTPANFTAICNPWLIKTPKPYDRQPALTGSYVLTKPSTCECQQLNYLQGQWTSQQNLGYTGSFSDFLLYKYGTAVDPQILNSLLGMCNGGSNVCRTLSKPFALPPVLQCNASQSVPPCVSCGQYRDLKSEFHAAFPSSAPAQQTPIAVPQGDVEVSWNNAFADFMNYKTGFRKTWREYLAFQNTCDGVYSAIDCASLDNALSAFYQTPQYQSNQTGNACVLAFVSYFNNAFAVNYSFDQWMQLFANCGKSPNVCKPAVTCTRFSELLEGFYVQNGPQAFKNGNCQGLFVTYMNTNLPGNFTFTELQGLYQSTCGGACSLQPCGFPNAFLLKRVVSAFLAANPKPWNLTDCKTAFADYFNNYFGLPWNGQGPYTFDQLLELYKPYVEKGCAPAIDHLCDPPYTCDDLKRIVDEFVASHSPVDQLPDCQGSFADFFNDHLGTQYTYAQIATLYQSICGVALDVCEAKADCKSLITFWQNYLEQKCTPDPKGGCVYDCTTFEQNFLNDFNSNFGTAYTSFVELQAAYEQCGYKLESPCGSGGAAVFTCEEIKVVLDLFYEKYPDPNTQLGDQCMSVFTALFNDQLQVQLTYEQIIGYYQSLCGMTPEVCLPRRHPCDFITNFNTQYSTMRLPKAAVEQLFVFEYAKEFLQGGDKQIDQSLELVDGKLRLIATSPEQSDEVLQLTFAELKDYLDGCAAPVGGGVGPTLASYEPDESSQVMLQSMKQAWYIMHPKGLPENCQSDFTSWYNTTMKTQRDYKDLLELFNTVCGAGSGYVCEPAPGSEAEAKIYLPITGTVPPPVQPPLLCGLGDPAAPPAFEDPSYCTQLPKIAFHLAVEKYELYLEGLKNDFDLAYKKKCLAAKDLESFTVQYSQSEYHYTLYYYDQAGNLVRTVAPAGVQKITDAVALADIKQKRNNVLNGGAEATNRRVPQHTLYTDYRYNTLNQVVEQQSPDGGLSRFWYDRLGRLAVSQNAEQRKTNRYSYTKYDDLGRITEVGQLPQSTAMDQTRAQDKDLLKVWVDGSGRHEQITNTVYDDAVLGIPQDLQTCYFSQQNLRGRVSYSYYRETEVTTQEDANYWWHHATIYSYDIHGNVSSLLQDFGNSLSPLSKNAMNGAGNRWKQIAYSYDLVSGKVNSVTYQKGKVDQFFHKYRYDDENRLVEASTSADGVVWDRDESYEYFRHGPLARTVLGELSVQGMDYAYTLQGWLKGVNSTSVGDGAFDMGKDGRLDHSVHHQTVARDAFGFSLNYFTGDYKPVDGGLLPFAPVSTGNDLYNGNIKAIAVNLPGVGDPQVYAYRYDQLNRLKNMDAYKGLDNATNAFTPISLQDYAEQVTYDPNGNIITYMRNGDAARLAMDNLHYTYKPGTNQLDWVRDDASDAGAADYTKYNDLKQNQVAGNYVYDAIGNLIQDGSEGIGPNGIKWSVYGKIRSVTKTVSGVGTTNISYTYDPSGNRISKGVLGTDNNLKETWYVRDAQGNVMGIYEQTKDLNNPNTPVPLIESEVYLYGSSRTGVWYAGRTVSGTQTPVSGPFQRGQKQYELSNHLGNVLATVTDRKIPAYVLGNIVSYYTADVVTAQDYYPFGMQMPKRSFSSAMGYRYGFNGKEDDPETSTQDYGMRIYNTRIGKFLSVDPLSSKYPSFSPYPYAMNSPIAGIDLDGLEFLSSEQARVEIVYGTVKLKMANMHFTTRRDFNDINENTEFWSVGPDGKKQVGVNTAIGSFSLLAINPAPTDIGYVGDGSPGAPDPAMKAGETPVGKQIAKSTGLPDRRYKDRSVDASPPGGTRTAAAISLAVDAIIVGNSMLSSYWLNDDEKLSRDHAKKALMALYDVNTAIQEGLIDKKFQNLAALSDIANVVLSGVSNTGNKEIVALGKKIFREVSMRREKFIGPQKRLVGMNGNFLGFYRELNPKFDPNYGKEVQKKSSN